MDIATAFQLPTEPTLKNFERDHRMSCYEWTKQTKFLLAVHHNFEIKLWIFMKINHNFEINKECQNENNFVWLLDSAMTVAESFKTMNRPDPTVTLFDGLFFGNY